MYPPPHISSVSAAWEADSAAFYPAAIDHIHAYNEKGWYVLRV